MWNALQRGLSMWNRYLSDTYIVGLSLKPYTAQTHHVSRIVSKHCFEGTAVQRLLLHRTFSNGQKPSERQSNNIYPPVTGQHYLRRVTQRLHFNPFHKDSIEKLIHIPDTGFPSKHSALELKSSMLDRLSWEARRVYWASLLKLGKLGVAAYKSQTNGFSIPISKVECLHGQFALCTYFPCYSHNELVSRRHVDD